MLKQVFCTISLYQQNFSDENLRTKQITFQRPRDGKMGSSVSVLYQEAHLQKLQLSSGPIHNL